MSSRAGIGGDRLARRTGDEVPVLVVLDRAHEVVVEADRVVRVLVLDRVEALAVDRHVEAGVAQGSGLVLLLGLAPDELADVGVVDVEDDHLRRAPRAAARLDRARPRIGAAHERHRAARRAALAQRLHRSTDLREVDPRSRAAAEDQALLRVPVEDRLHRVVDRQDEAGRHLVLGAVLGMPAAVEPHRRVEGRHLVQQDVGELGLEAVAVLGGGEVPARATPVGDRAGDAADHLLDRALARGRAQLPSEVLLGDDVRGVLRPRGRELDVGLLEGDLVAMTDARVAQLPLDGVEGMNPGRRETTTDRQRLRGVDVLCDLGCEFH